MKQKRVKGWWLGAGLGLALPGWSAGPGLEPAGSALPPAEALSAAGVRDFLTRYCFDCHDTVSQKGGVDLESASAGLSILTEPRLWSTVIEMLQNGEMPPKKKRQPSEAEREQVLAFVRGELARVDCTGESNPGRVTLRRLNRAEYHNTIRDLFGIDFRPTADIPLDEVGYGFDNIGDVLSLSPLLFEKYLAAAEEIASRANLAPHPPPAGQEVEEARRILRRLARRAWRRPVGDEEVERLAGLVELARSRQGTFAEGIQLAVQAVLVSPQFLFRWELDSRGAGAGTIRTLTDHELASRLSYFLWSSLPDETLFALAEEGRLHQPEVLEAQTRRMLQDPKASALVEHFAGQWLQLRLLDRITPDPDLFPGFDEPLRRAMRRETELFFEAIVREERSLLDILDSDFTYLNERLARHYGVSGVGGDHFQRVRLGPESRRGGVLTQASILTLTSNPTRTSPVNRGKWILEQILGTPPPPPPADVPELDEPEPALQTASLRERMELHRAKPECATCHSKMDPIGFAFEHFDAIGAWRERDGRFPIDPSGKLPGGQTFRGPEELKRLLRTQDTFVRTVTEKMLTYALGRGLQYFDRCAVDRICEELARNGHRFPVLIVGIVQSEPFTRKNERTN